MRNFTLLITVLIVYSCGPLKDVYCENLNETVRVPRNPDKYQKIYTKERTKKFKIADFEFVKGVDFEMSDKIVQLTEKFNQSNTSFELASSKLIYLTSIRPCAQENYASQLAKLSTDFLTLNNELEKIKAQESISKEEVEKVIDKVEKETIKIDSISKKLPEVEQVKKKFQALEIIEN